MERKTSFLFFSVGQLLSHVSSLVPPATNVTLDCHNFQNTLHWHYSQHDSLKPRFKVYIQALTGMPELLLVDYPNLQCDLSSFRSPDDDYLVSVTALVGLNESLPAPPDGWTFSYFYGTPSMLQCSLDLQSVNITAQSGAGIKFSFNHPSALYHHKLLTKPKRRQRKPEARQAKKVSVFTYNVEVTSDKTTYPFDCVTDVCEGSIPAELQQDTYCVKFYGSWEKMAVHGTQDYCTKSVLPPTTSHQVLYIGLGVLALGLMALFILTFTFCFKKVHGSSPMPPVLDFERNTPDRGSECSGTPLMRDPTSMSPVSPVFCGPVSPFKLSAEDNRETDEKEHKVVSSNDGPPAGEPAADPFDARPSQAAECAGLGDPSVEPRAGDDPGRAAGDIGPGRPNAGGLGEGSLEVEPGFGVQNASGYEQRERLVTTVALITPGEKIDAYHF